MLKNEEIVLRKACAADQKTFYALMTTNDAWTKFNAPYFPYSAPTPEAFEKGLFRRLCDGRDALVIEYKEIVIGNVSCYWEDERTRWLEIGIAIYDQTFWNKGIGRKALKPWVTHLFHTLKIERVGLTTWSGNPGMIACAESIGMKIEGRIRRVRYFEGVYYDSIKLGVIREEWFGMERR